MRRLLLLSLAILASNITQARDENIEKNDSATTTLLTANAPYQQPRFDVALLTADTANVAVRPGVWTDERTNHGVIFQEHEPIDYVDCSHNLHWAQLAVPAAVTVACGIFARNPRQDRMISWVQRQLSNPTGNPRTKIDNYMQFIPAASVFGINLCGLKGEHDYAELAILMAMSYATFSIVTNTLKYTVKEPRSNNGALNSFPSGHTGTAFAGAEMLRREYWKTNKLIGVLGYACATTVAYLRIYNNRHWINDVLAGASLGYMSTTFAYWLYPKLFRRMEARHAIAKSRRQKDFTYFAMPYVSTSNVGVACQINF